MSFSTGAYSIYVPATGAIRNQGGMNSKLNSFRAESLMGQQRLCW